MPSSSNRLVFVLLLTCALHGVMPAQGPQPAARRLTGPSCGACRIDLKLVGELDGGEKGADLSNGALRVVRSGSGELFAAGWSGEVYRFGPTGKYLGLLGRKGEGPGEFKAPNAISLDRQGNLHFLDPAIARHSVFSAAGKYLSASRYPPEFVAREFYVTPDGEIVVAATIRLANAIGFPMHRTSNGQIAASFGPEVPIRPGTSDEAVRYALGTARGGGFWAVKMTSLELELRRDDGALVRALTATRPWLPVTNRLGPVGPTQPLPPRLSGVVERDDGLVVLYGKVAGPNWEQAWGPPAPNPIKGPNVPLMVRKLINPDLAYDTFILVVDPVRNVILSERRFDQNVVEFVDPRHVLTRSIVDEEVVLKVWEVVITQPGGKR